MNDTNNPGRVMTYNAEAESAIADLRGVACILRIMACADETGYRNVSDAYGVLGEVVGALAECLGDAIENPE